MAGQYTSWAKPWLFCLLQGVVMIYVGASLRGRLKFGGKGAHGWTPFHRTSRLAGRQQANG